MFDSHRNNEEKGLLALVKMMPKSSPAADRKGWDEESASNVPYCEWEGITCDQGGSSTIVELRLSDMGLTGTLPTELGLFTDLTYLSLAGNMLRGTIPLELTMLTKLATLDLTGCFLTGTLPQYFSSPHLASLLLADNAISGQFFHKPNSPHLPSIHEVRLENNLLTGTIHGSTLAQMTDLVSLSLSNNDLSGLLPAEHLGSLSALKYVYLDSNSLVGPLSRVLATHVGAPSLLELWLQDNALSGTVPASYAQFDEMHSFYIDGNKLTGELPQDLCGPTINVDFFKDAPTEAERNYCDSIACPAGSVALEGVYPCSRCPGGEAARLHNRYLGQTGDCVNYTDRDVLQIFHGATTKGGPWNGIDDWSDETKPVCEMTGIGCDTHGRVTSINLKGRGLEGHLPKEIGSLTNLETLDVSDNNLMGYMPSDVRWTSLTLLDISGNRIRGLIPPLLCMIDGLNDNGRDGAFYCDRIACPPGTYNSIGRLDGSGERDEACMSCPRHVTPFLGQKSCAMMPIEQPLTDVIRETVKHAGETTWVLAMVITMVALFVALVLVCAVRRSEKYWRSKNEAQRVDANYEAEAMIMNSSSRSDDDDDEYEDRKGVRGGTISSEEDVDAETNYYDYIDIRGSKGGNDTSYDDDDNTSRASSHSRARSATELIHDHQGISLKKGEKIRKKVHHLLHQPSRVPVAGDIGRRAREAASTINVSARRLRSRGSNVSGGGYTVTSSISRRSDYSDGEDCSPDLEMTSPSTTPSQRRTKVYQSSDLLDVPMVT